MGPWILNGWMVYYNNFRQYLLTCSLQFSFYVIPCVWFVVYCCTFYLWQGHGSLGCEVAAQIVLLKFYQFSSLCIVDLIRVMCRVILVIFGSFLFKLGVREGVLAFHFTFICEGRFGHVFREMVFCWMFLAVGIRLQRRPGRGWKCDDFNFHIKKKLGFMCYKMVPTVKTNWSNSFWHWH